MKNKLIKLISLVALATSVSLSSRVLEFSGRDEEPLTEEEARAVHLAEEAARAEEARLRGVVFDVISNASNILEEDKFEIEYFFIQGVMRNQIDAPISQSGGTLLSFASSKGYVEIVKLLLDFGANPNEASLSDGTTPFMIATEEGHKDIVELFIAAGADVNKTKNYDGATPLIIAVEEGYKDIVNLLIAADADVNRAALDDGTTPLIIAVEKDSVEIIEILLSNGADLTLKLHDTKSDFNGLTALEIAVGYEYEDIANIIREEAKRREAEQCVLRQKFADEFYA